MRNLLLMFCCFSLETFASTDFTIGTQYDTEVYGLPAKAIRFSAQLVDDQATLIITTFIFTSEGAISPTSTESFSVFKGSVKFNVEVRIQHRKYL